MKVPKAAQTVVAALLKRGYGAFVVKIVSVFTGLGLAALLARTLGKDDYGVYAYVTSWVTVLAIPASLKAQQLVARLGASYQATNQLGLLKGLLSHLRIRVFIASCLVAVLSTSVAFTLPTCGVVIPAMDPIVFGIAMLSLPLIGLGQLAQGYLEARQAITRSQLPEVIAQQGIPILLLLCVLASGHTVGAATAAFVLVAGFLGYLVTQLYFASRVTTDAFRLATATTDHAAWTGRLLPLVASGLFINLTLHSAPLVLGFLGTKSDVALLVAASRFANVLTFLPAALYVGFGVASAAAWSKGEVARISHLGSQATIVSFSANLLASAPLLLWPEVFLAILGPEFEDGGTLLRILAIGQLAYNAVGPGGILLIMTGHEKTTARAVMLGSAVTTVLAILLTQLWGAVGAAFSVAFGMTFSALLMSISAFRQTGARVDLLHAVTSISR